LGNGIARAVCHFEVVAEFGLFLSKIHTIVVGVVNAVEMHSVFEMGFASASASAAFEAASAFEKVVVAAVWDCVP
jgi:hypothetical protein